MGKYYTQLVCLNGHQITDRLESFSGIKDFCKDCGSPTISKCQSCDKSILGHYEVSGVVYIGSSTADVPSYCPSCGEAFPWTSNILSNAVELISLDTQLDEKTKNIIKSAIPDLLIDMPATNVAVAKYKLNISKATKVVKDSMYNMLIDVVSDTAKKAFFD